MIFGSVCSGIEAASVAWHPLGWRAAFFSEIEPFPCAVLAHHYPQVPNFGDMTKFQEWPDASIDLLVGGTPCQSFSVAGLGKGLDEPRGQLTLTYLAIARRYRPRWLVWENVPGVLSNDGGRAFGAFLGGLAQLGYGFAYRILDAQHFGVPQRRRRVFVVGYLGDWRRAAAVLFERESLRRDSAPSREAREGTAPTLAARTRGGGGLGTDFDCDGGLIARSLNAHGVRLDMESETFVAHSLRADGFDASEDGTGRGTPLVASTLRGGGSTPGSHGKRSGTDRDTLVCFDETQVTSRANRSNPHPGDPSHLLASGARPPAIAFDPQGGGKQTTLGASAHGVGAPGTKKTPAVAFGQETGDDYANAYEADASSVLSELRRKAGAQAVAEWGSRILDSLQSEEVLRSWLHGESIRRASGDFRSFVDDRPLSRSEASSAVTLRKVWEQGPDGRTSQGRGLAKQLAYELRKALPKLPSAGTQIRSSVASSVRRLTPKECARLQGFPDDYLDITYRGKPAADGPRYKALGNSMAVPVMAWIGERIAAVELATKRSAA